VESYARRLVTFFVSPKKVTKERRPRQPRNPEAQARRTGGKELAPLLLGWFDFCERGSNTFAADPPDALDLRRGCKERKLKTRVRWPDTCIYYFSFTHPAHYAYG